MVESLHSQTGLMLSVHQSLAAGGAWLFDIADALGSWSHTSQADGGFWSGRAGLVGKQLDLEDWIENGLGRRMILYGPELLPCWDGFVNVVTVNLGGLSYKIGPLLNVANYVRNVYSTVDTSITPPAVGVRATTGWYSDADSIARYGRMEKVLSSGGSTAANAAQNAQMYLGENSRPPTSQTVTPGGGDAPVVSLELLGHSQWLQTYYYNSTAAGTTTSLARLQAILAASPSVTYSTDYGEMDANATPLPAYENDDKKAWDLVKAAVAPGDPADYTRFTFGVYEDLKAYYKKLPSAVEYIYRIATGFQVETPGGARVEPWNVRPARWMSIPDFLVGRATVLSDLRSDPRNLFVESVTYTAPYGLSVNGGRVQELPQKLARLGLSGIGG